MLAKENQGTAEVRAGGVIVESGRSENRDLKPGRGMGRRGCVDWRRNDPKDEAETNGSHVVWPKTERGWPKGSMHGRIRARADCAEPKDDETQNSR